MPYFPFGKLPTELLVSIFEYGEMSSRSSKAVTLSYSCPERPFSILITHVCGLWRHVAINAATLWVDVRIIFEYGVFRNSEIVHLYLERSKSCPLDITCAYQTMDPVVRGITEHVLPCADRWRVLTIMAGDEDQLDQILHLFKDVSSPLLETIRLSFVSSSFYPGDQPTQLLLGSPIFLGGAPRLHTVRFRSIPCSVQPAFANLVAVTLVAPNHGEYSLATLREFLGYVSQSLVYLRVQSWSVEDLTTDSMKPIDLPVLQYLSITFSPILLLISAPKLEKLSLEYIYDDTGLTTLSDNASFVSLRHLVLASVSLACFVNKLHFPATYPHITTLTFIRCSDESSLLNLLQDHKDGHPISSIKNGPSDIVLPHLHELAISDMRNWPLVQSILAERIAKGCKTISRVCVPSGVATRAILHHLKKWLSAQEIELEVFDCNTPCPQFQYGEGEQEWQHEAEQFDRYVSDGLEMHLERAGRSADPYREMRPGYIDSDQGSWETSDESDDDPF